MIQKEQREKKIIQPYKIYKNLESRIYAQMAKQLVESMFSNDDAVRFGTICIRRQYSHIRSYNE